MVAPHNRDALTRQASVTTPFEMAIVLFNASATGAAAYARAAQQDAAERGDDRRTAFWQQVGRDLDTLRDWLDVQEAA